MADSQLILELLFLQRRGGCSLTVLLFFLMLVGTCCFMFTIIELIKQSRPGTKKPLLAFTSFQGDQSLFFSYMEEYIRRTQFLRRQGNTQLFNCFAYPYQPVQTTTLSRWIKIVTQEAEIDFAIISHILIKNLNSVIYLSQKLICNNLIISNIKF